MLLEQGNQQRELIVQNLQTLQELSRGQHSEMVNLVIHANSTRDTMLKVMKTHYQSFDDKLTNIYNELQAQA